MGAAALIIPLLPGLVDAVLGIVNAIKTDDSTPAELKAKLDSISSDLQIISAKVQAVELPTAGG